MASFQAEPDNFVELLQTVGDGCEISLKSGEYKGPFTINHSITIRGVGTDTVLFTVDEPALTITVPGVRLENLTITRTIGVEEGEIVLSATSETAPICQSVTLTGIAPNIHWEGGNWDIPNLLDFGEIETNRQVERSWQLQIGAPCKIISDFNWLRVPNCHLYPGTQILQLVLNSTDILAGTILSGSILIEAEDENRTIEITAIIKAEQSNNVEAIYSVNSKSRIENWGYKFANDRAIDKFIREIQGEAFIEKSERIRRERAETLMSYILGDAANLFYVRRQEAKQKHDEETWELIIATDREDFPLPPELKQLQKTLRLIVSARPEDGGGGLKLRDASLLFPARGKVDGFAASCYLKLLPNHLRGIPAHAIAKINNLPLLSDRHVPTYKQLQVWHTFLEIEERIAKARQFCVGFVSNNDGYDSRRVTFEIDVTSATIDGNSENSLNVDELWKRAFQSKNEDLMLFESSPKNRNVRDGEKLGNITEIERKSNKIKIRLDSDLVERINRGRYQLPKKGFLYFEAAGDIYQIERKQNALENLKKGRCQNTYLSKFLFDASQARIPKKIIKLEPEDLLKRNANPEQIAAVEAVLSSPDMVLIQGPPGTGKTTVIAEICYQIALRGGKTLIASQANLAVDNALSRLVHNPVIRALRKGKAERVQEEGQAFLEENVIGKWLQNTADDCETSLSKRQENVELFEKLLAPSQKFSAYLKFEEEFQNQQSEVQNHKAQLKADSKQQEKISEETLEEKSKIIALITNLDNLLKSVPNIDWENPQVTNFLPLLKPYTTDNILVENFLTNVRTAINNTAELGLIRPNRGVFGLAAWLRDTVAIKISELSPALIYVKNAATAMSEVAASVQAFKENSTTLNEAQANYQKIIIKQQVIEPKINKLHKRKCEIDFVITAVKEWKSTANSRLYQILSNCRQTGELLTDDVIQLPAGLLMIAKSLNLPLLSTSYKVTKVDYLPNWAQLTNALSYESEGNFIDRRGKQHTFSYFLHQSFSQVPMVLMESDRVQWQEFGQKYNNYPQIPIIQRQVVIKHTHKFLTKIEPIYARSWDLNNIESTLHRVVEELVENILVNGRLCVKQVKIQTEQELEHLQQQLIEIQTTENNLRQQISATQYQVETAQQQANLKISQVIHLLQQLTQQPNLAEKFHILSEQYLRKHSGIWEQPQPFITLANSWESSITNLESLIPSLEPFSVLENIKDDLHQHRCHLEQKNENATQQIAELEIKINELEIELEKQTPSKVIQQRKWWQQIWQEIPDQLQPKIPTAGLFSLDFLRKIQAQFDLWQRELEQDKSYLKRYQNFVQDWITKLHNPSAQDRNELKQIYIDNANVIGITCVQAARGDFSKEFPSFDVAIIDEVSKCTPPELLIPALKAKKIVLVGDHRQLPPMLREDTIEDIVAEMGTSKEELSFIKESLFKHQFESAHDSIKKMLATQYRMHPQIMGAINQFYEHRLNCGILEPDLKRAHNLAGEIIQENQHILWIKTPIGDEFAEKKEGTSRFNLKEVDIIERLCEQMESAWLPKIADGQPPKEIGIITFYGAQLKLIKDRIESDKFPSLSIRTGTVDIFQGMERPVIIVSTVCNNTRGDIGFAKQPERVNVAFSRAQELLVVVGCHDLFTQQPGQVGKMYQEVSKVVSRYGGFIDFEF